MKDAIIPLLAGLAGSILTLLLGKILEIVQAKQKHNFVLKEAFHSRRLEVLEKAVAFWTASQQSYNAIAVVFRQFGYENVELSQEAVREMLSLNQQQINRITEKVETYAFAARLYIDYKSDVAMDAIHAFSRVNGELTLMFNDYNHLADLQLAETNPSFFDVRKQELTRLSDLIQGKLQELQSTINSINQYYEECIDTARTRLRIFH